MGDNEKVIETNGTSSVELSSSLLEQLGKAFTELETCKVSSSDHVPWNDVEAHFHNVESMMKKKLEELEAKQKEFTERESHNHMLLGELEATVVAKEQDLLDSVQELKDAAVAAITKARASCILDSLDLVDGVDANGNKVSSSADDEIASLDTQRGTSPHKMGENVEGVSFEVIPHAELTHYCETMDSTGLVKFVTENLKNLSTFWKEQLSVALGSATEPARLVLDALEGFFPPKEMAQDGISGDAALVGMRESCLILMEALAAFISKADCATDNYFNPETQQKAKFIANEWFSKLTGDSRNATNGNPLEAEGFLRLLATFRIASEFDEEELCKYILVVAHHRQAIELCRSLDLTQKIPGLIETLTQIGRHIDAVHIIHAFQLSEAFPPVPLLKTYLKELRRNSQGNGSAALQNNYNARELEALRAVIGCVEEYKLEAEYPLDPLHRRVAQLDKSAKGDTKRPAETGKQQQQKRPRSDGGFHGSRGRGRDRGRGFGSGRHGRGRPLSGERATYIKPEMYIPAVPSAYSYQVATHSLNAAPSAYSYQVAAHSPNAAQVSDQRLSGYPQDTRPRGPYSLAAPAYSYQVAAQSPNAAQVNDQRLSYYPQDTRPRGPYSPAAPTHGSYLHPSRQSFPQ